MKPKYGLNIPCAGCTNRAVGCHGVCGEYKDYRSKLDVINADIRLKQTNANTVESYRNIARHKIMSKNIKNKC